MIDFKENIFTEVQNVRNRVMKDILKNQDILKLVSIASPDSLAQPDIKAIGKLIDKYIYFKPKVFNDSVTEVQSFLLNDVSIIATNGRNSYSDVRIVFRIIVHNTLFEIEDGRSRTYLIAEKLTDLFYAKEGSWLGKVDFLSCYQLEVPMDYHGVEVTFSVTDFK